MPGDEYIKRPIPDAIDQKRKVYAAIAAALIASRNCEQNGNTDWLIAHKARIDWLVKQYLPSGGGFDAGTKLDLIRSKAGKLVFNTSYHHMNDAGYYDGWTEHAVTIVPTFDDCINIASITGRDRNSIKEYIADVFS